MKFLKNFLIALKYTFNFATFVVCLAVPPILTFSKCVWWIFAYIITVPIAYAALIELMD